MYSVVAHRQIPTVIMFSNNVVKRNEHGEFSGPTLSRPTLVLIKAESCDLLRQNKASYPTVINYSQVISNH